jgi:hypothetical protein
MTWGWIKPVLDFFLGWFMKSAEAETKATEAKTTDETRDKFKAQLGARIKPEPPAADR